MAIDSTEQGLPLEEYPQTLGNFNMPTRELERLILSGKAVIDNNEINRYCFRNVTLKSDYNGNVKPNKAVDKKKIDGTIAMIQALGMYLRTPHYTNEILNYLMGIFTNWFKKKEPEQEPEGYSVIP